MLPMISLVLFESLNKPQMASVVKKFGSDCGGFGFSYGFAFFTGNSIPSTGWEHSFAADDAEPPHHFAQEGPQPGNLIKLVANAYHHLERQVSLGRRTDFVDQTTVLSHK